MQHPFSPLGISVLVNKTAGFISVAISNICHILLFSPVNFFHPCLPPFLSKLTPQPSKKNRDSFLYLVLRNSGNRLNLFCRSFQRYLNERNLWIGSCQGTLTSSYKAGWLRKSGQVAPPPPDRRLCRPVIFTYISGILLP